MCFFSVIFTCGVHMQGHVVGLLTHQPQLQSFELSHHIRIIIAWCPPSLNLQFKMTYDSTRESTTYQCKCACPLTPLYIYHFSLTWSVTLWICGSNVHNIPLLKWSPSIFAALHPALSLNNLSLRVFPLKNPSVLVSNGPKTCSRCLLASVHSSTISFIFPWEEGQEITVRKAL